MKEYFKKIWSEIKLNFWVFFKSHFKITKTDKFYITPTMLSFYGNIKKIKRKKYRVVYVAILFLTYGILIKTKAIEYKPKKKNKKRRAKK